MASYAVPHSHELDRILALPRRTWTSESASVLAEKLSAALRVRGGTRTLRPHQAQVLLEARQTGTGAFASIPVSGGKTDISFLAPVVMGARKPLLITRGSLITSGKTDHDFGELAKQWISPAPITMVSYQRMALLEAESFLREERFDLIMLDEAHGARNMGAAVTKRLERHKRERAAAGETLPFVVMTGTIYRKSLRNIAHLLAWSLEDGAPLPWRHGGTLRDWCHALDWQVAQGQRLRPGSLLELARHWLPPGKLAELTGPAGIQTIALPIARLALQRWMAETPGVIVVDDSDCDQPINIRFRLPPKDASLEEAFVNFRTTDETPDGWKMADSIVRYGHESELGAGFYNIIDPRPPEPWANARREAVAFVREKIANTQRSAQPLDTERQVFLRHPHAPEVLAWREIRDTFKPKSRPVWLTGSVAYWVAQWLRDNAPALIWVQHNAVGETLSSLTGVGYYSSEGRTASGASIVDLRPPASAIVSVHSIREGFNLPFWSRNLVVGWPQPGDQCEQMIGRTHRSGQEQPVSFDVLVLSGLTLRAFKMAHAESSQVLELMGQRHKILKASLDMSELSGYNELSKTESRFVYKEPDFE